MLFYIPLLIQSVDRVSYMYISSMALKVWAYHYFSKKPLTGETFHQTFKEEHDFFSVFDNSPELMGVYHTMAMEVSDIDWMDGAICCYDDSFPVVHDKIPLRDKPYLLFYKGDISLLEDSNQNVAVIGYTTPTMEIQERERSIVQHLVREGQYIVSGLAKGCDGVAHMACMEAGGKTIAILPTPLNAIYPAVHKEMARQIVDTGGLVLTEYYKPARGRQEAISRFIERDRLQALFAKSVVLIASYEGRDGDSGSRHAMNKAYEYGHIACAMYNGKTDIGKKEMKLNRTLLMTGRARQITEVKVELSEQDRAKYIHHNTPLSIGEIAEYRNSRLERL